MNLYSSRRGATSLAPYCWRSCTVIIPSGNRGCWRATTSPQLEPRAASRRSVERFTATAILWAEASGGILRDVTDAPMAGDADGPHEGLNTYLEALASGVPTPGGGSAA